MDKLFLIPIFAIILLSGCTTTQPTTTSSSSVISSITTTSATSSITTTVSQTSTVTANVKNFTVAEHSFAISPATITVNRGDSVQITVISNDIGHDFCIEGYNVCSSIVSSGQSTTLNFVANQAGTFAYYCNIDGHRQLGMQGQLIVQ
jgi:plastocyanin